MASKTENVQNNIDASGSKIQTNENNDSASGTSKIQTKPLVPEVPDDEIPPITYRNVENDSEDDESELTDNKRVVPLFIADLFKAELVSKKLFKFKNVLFKTVHIRGIVVENSVLENKLVMSIDDGTGQIHCFYEQSQRLLSIRQEIKDFENEFILQENPEGEDSIIRKGIQMMIRTTQSILGDIPQEPDIKLGDTVEIIGNLSEYNSKRNIFVKHIVRNTSDGVDEDNKYMKFMFDFYENFSENCAVIE